MDCEKFDRVVLDLLYEELDELTAAAARRHMDHCARCGPIGAGLRATREIGVLPAVSPPPGLRERILDAERSARAELSVRQRLGRTISVLAGYAMRPQLAMAAVLILMVGMSLMLLQPRPGSRDSARVTERGVPEMDTEALAETPLSQPSPVPTTSLGASQAHGPLRDSDHDVGVAEDALARKSEGTMKTATEDDPFQAALSEFRAGRYSESRSAFEAIAAEGGEQSARAELMAARAARYTSGCTTSVDLLENVAAQHAGTEIAHEANWFAATCYRDLGRTLQATHKLTALSEVPGYSERAQNVLDQLSAGTSVAARSRAVAASKPGAPAKPAPLASSGESAPPAAAQRETDENDSP